MNIEEIRDYLLNKTATTESTPFDNVTLVYKVKNKMYALMSTTGELKITLKCDPEEAIELREKYHFVKAGFHMNKKLWNTIEIIEPITNKQITKWIDDSYKLVVKGLTKKLQAELQDEIK